MLVDNWHDDLKYLQQKLEQRHANLYHDISKENFKKGIEELMMLSGKIDDKELVIRISELIAKVKDAHTWLHPGYQEKWLFKRLPINFDYFEDGLFVIDADKKYKHLIGSKLISVNSNSVSEIIPKIKQIGYNENEFTQLLSLTRFIAYPDVLKRFGFINDVEQIFLELKSKNFINKFEIKPMSNDSINWVKYTNLKQDLPVTYKNNDSIYWSEYLDRDKVLYVQLNSCVEDGKYTFENLSSDIIDQTENLKPKKLVIDLRRNVGGNSQLTYPLIYALKYYERYIPNGQIFVIIGRWTLSASIVLNAEINKFCSPIFIGEPTGAKPNLYGENGYKLLLPHSRLKVSYSSEWFQPSGPFVRTPWIPTDIYIPITSNNYFNLEEPILDEIKRYNKPKINLSERIYELAINDKIKEAIQVYNQNKKNIKNKFVDTSDDIRRMAKRLGRAGKLEYCKLFFQLNNRDYPDNAKILAQFAYFLEGSMNEIEEAKNMYKRALSVLKDDNQTNNYFKHYLEDFVNERLKALN